ncbi:MAG: helix-turn-helix transcriptional regulator [Lachnospiraceae bacterium]|nr:helix-turn-helix transcriptional regulator [Lachnospiraceae bacterium]
MDTFFDHEADGIYSRHVREEKADDRGFTMHIHDRCELYYFMEGSADYLVEGNEYPMKRGSMLIMRPGEVHRPRLLKSGVYERFAINFPLNLFDGIDPDRRLVRPFTDRALGTGNHYDLPAAEKFFVRLCAGFPDEYERRIAAYSSILEILLLLGKEFEGRSDSAEKPDTQSEKLIRYVNGHLFEDISLPAIADEFYISLSSLGRIFREATGAAPWEYITAKRLIAAGELMSKGVPAGEAAERCGFGDYSSFYRAWVRRYGKSPREGFS